MIDVAAKVSLFSGKKAKKIILKNMKQQKKWTMLSCNSKLQKCLS